MVYFKTSRGNSLIYILSLAIIANLFMGVLSYLVDSYVLLVLLKIAWSSLDAYFLYYLILNISTIYKVDENYITIKYFWGLRSINIAFEDIEGYDIYEGNIRGVKLTGIGNNKFSFGRNIIDRIGTTYMFVTSSKKVIYIKTSSMSYGISPQDINALKVKLDKKGIVNGIADFSVSGSVDLYKDKKFNIPFILVTVIILVLTLNPFILYLRHSLPQNMPLNFNATFEPILIGSGKQFAFKQMTYGVLNMIILLCMYYAAYFCAKYDKKTAYKYIYIALIIALTFLIMQIRILSIFK